MTTPAATHAISSQKGELTVREMSAETMKIPDPIIEPATSIVASVSVSALTNPPEDAEASPVPFSLLKSIVSEGVGRQAVRAQFKPAGDPLLDNRASESGLRTIAKKSGQTRGSRLTT